MGSSHQPRKSIVLQNDEIVTRHVSLLPSKNMRGVISWQAQGAMLNTSVGSCKSATVTLIAFVSIVLLWYHTRSPPNALLALATRENRKTDRLRPLNPAYALNRPEAFSPWALGKLYKQKRSLKLTSSKCVAHHNSPPRLTSFLNGHARPGALDYSQNAIQENQTCL